MAREYRLLRIAYIRYLEERRKLRLERRHIRDNQNPFDLPDDVFTRLFRSNKQVARYICQRLEPALRRRRRSGLTPQNKVLVALRFYAEGGYQRGVGQDMYLGNSQTSVSRTINNVTNAICDVLMPEWIRFPATNFQRRQLGQRFREVVGFPDVLGAIDCTHVAILRPHEHEEGYRNHKGFHSLNIQMICDYDMRIMNVVAYPGSVHDQFIWNHSQAKASMRETYDQRLGKFFLLGDSGYALEPWLLTPLPHAPAGTPQARYTDAHCRARNCVERLFGVLKGRWRCILKSRTLNYQPEIVAKIVLACATLHNIMIHYRLPLPRELADEENDLAFNEPQEGDRLTIARHNQNEIINQYFG